MAGNRTSQLFYEQRIIVDNTPPFITTTIQNNDVFVVPSVQVIEFMVDDGSEVMVTVKDPSGSTIFTHTSAYMAGSCSLAWETFETFEDGIYTIEFRGLDELMNGSVPVIRTITVTHDITPPVLDVPEDMTVEAVDILTPVNVGTANAFDDSPPVDISNDTPELFPLGTTPVTWTATDRYGNASNGIQHITVIDSTPPVLFIPEDITMEATALETPVIIGEAIAGDIFDVTVTNNALTAYPVGGNIVTWTAVDGNGNITTDTQLITITDTTPPVLTVPADIIEVATGFTTPVDIGAATAEDIFPVTIENDAPESFPLGTTVVTWKATDANGVSAQAEQTITIIDENSPVITISGVSDGADYTESATPVIDITDAESGVDTSQISLDGLPCESGTAVTEPGIHVLEAVATDYAGNSTTLAVTFSIYCATSLVVSGADGVYSDVTVLSATLLARQTGVAGKAVIFSVDGITAGTGLTDETGNASIAYTPIHPAGDYPVTVTFVQDDADFLRATEGASHISVESESAAIAYTGHYLVQYPSPVLLSAQVTQDNDGEPGELVLSGVRFLVKRTLADGSEVFVNHYDAPCNENGVAAVSVDMSVGMYSITATLLGHGYFTATDTSALVPVYNPESGMTTGGGWIHVDNPAYGNTGKYNFGFNVKYKNGEPEGSLQLHYHETGIKLKAESFEWLVIDGMTSQFQGVGTIKDQTGSYTFRISCYDNGNQGDEERITIIVWEGTDTNTQPVLQAINQVLGGGNLKVTE
jgi:hypothetical protein